MATKTRFNKSNQGLASSLVGGNTRSTARGAPGGSEFGTAVAGTKAQAHVQVIYNGKIVTPVSLLAKSKDVTLSTQNVVKDGDMETKATAQNVETGAHSAEEDKPAGKPLSRKESMAGNRSRYVNRVRCTQSSFKARILLIFSLCIFLLPSLSLTTAC